MTDAWVPLEGPWLPEMASWLVGQTCSRPGAVLCSCTPMAGQFHGAKSCAAAKSCVLTAGAPC
jgi:hypothetical protein